MDLGSFLPDGLTSRRPVLTESGTPVSQDLKAILALCRASEMSAIGTMSPRCGSLGMRLIT